MPDATLARAFRPGTLASVTRARSLPVLLMPPAVGAALAWTVTGRLAWSWFAVTLAGVAFGALGINVLDDVWDDVSGADAAARADGLSAPTGSDAIASGALTRGRALVIACALLGVSAACFVVIGSRRSWWALALGAASFALASGATAPGVRYGSRVPFAAELGALAAAGMLPLVASYASQARGVDGVAFEAGVVPGIALMLVYFHQSFLRHRSDGHVGRPNTVSRLGPRRALVASAAFAAAGVAVLLVEVARRVWPVWGLLALAGVFPLLAGYKRMAEEPEAIHVQLPFLGAAVGSAAVVNAVLGVSLVLRGAAR